MLAHLPVEPLVHDRQADYYSALSEADKRSEATVFVEFMLQAILDAMSESEAASSVKSSEKSSEIVIDLLMTSPSMSARELASKLEMTPRGVEKILARLRELGQLERIGGARNGHWIVKVKKP